MLVKEINLKDFEIMSFEQQSREISRLWGFITRHLEKKDLNEFNEFWKKVDPNEKEKLIKLLNSYLDYARESNEIKNGFKFILEYFPEEYDIIKRDFDAKFEGEKYYYLREHLIVLQSALNKRLEREISTRLKRLKETMKAQEYVILIEKIDCFKSIQKRILYLNNNL